MSRVYSSFPENYELIDAGGGKKLERWGSVLTIRPENLAYFPSSLSFKEWQQMAHWEFVPDKPASLNGQWKLLKQGAPKEWEVRFSGICMNLAITGNKHIGLFPEQQYNWQFIQDILKPEHRFLNLFAYTGAASLAGRLTGAEVTHVDSVRNMLDWGRRNMESSSLADVKWVLEDARKFVNRECKRGNRYDLVQMDPPAWGLGAKGEKWRIEDLLPELLRETAELLRPNGTLIVNTYSPKITLSDLQQMVRILAPECTGEVHELWMETTHGKHLHYGLVARVKRHN